MADSVANFAFSTVATAPSPATTGTSLVVASGDGTLFPAVPFNAVVYPSDADPSTSNAEIVRVTAVSTDTLTITREQESTSARTIVTGDRIHAGVTKAFLESLVAKSLFNANTILSADSDDTPAALSIAASSIVARLASGNIKAATLTEILDLVGSAANGDILIRSGGSWTRLAKGTDGQVLTLASGVPSWAAATGGGGGGGGVWSLLETVECASQSEIDFVGDGVNYEDLTDTAFEEFKIVFDGVEPSATSQGLMRVIENGAAITSNVYHYHSAYITDGVNWQHHKSTGTSLGYIHRASHSSVSMFSAEIIIPRWSPTDYPMWRSHATLWASFQSIGYSVVACGLNADYANIEGVKLYRNTGDWGTTGSIKLYGRAA